MPRQGDCTDSGAMPAHPPIDPELDALAKAVIDAAFKVHRALGPGLLESVYEACLCEELRIRKIGLVRQHALPVVYEGAVIDGGLRIDLLVGDRLIVEIKAVENLQPLHEAQLLTYLKLAKLRLGLLINFNVRSFRQGVRRLIL
jgi:GxxExxY protein